MAYDKETLEKLALSVIQREQLIWIEEVISFLPCVKSTFYGYDLHESNTIKKELETNRINQKIKLRNKMLESDNPTLIIACYKLLGTDEETTRLSGKVYIERATEVKYDGFLNNVKPPDE